jgi:hypothetical protein
MYVDYKQSFFSRLQQQRDDLEVKFNQLLWNERMMHTYGINWPNNNIQGNFLQENNYQFSFFFPQGQFSERSNKFLSCEFCGGIYHTFHECKLICLILENQNQYFFI